jgi:integrase
MLSPLAGIQAPLCYPPYPASRARTSMVCPNQTTVRPDPRKPMTTWRSAWRSLRASAAKGDPENGIPPMPGLARLRFHVLRHHPSTELAETAASDQIIRSIAGHVSQKMLDHYSHVRLGAKRRTLDALSSTRPDSQNQGTSEGGTSHGTSQNWVWKRCQMCKLVI